MSAAKVSRALCDRRALIILYTFEHVALSVLYESHPVEEAAAEEQYV